MKKWMIALSVCAAVFTACDKEDEDDELNSTDRNFVTMASISNNAEIGAGQLAAQKGMNSMVKTYGNQMVSEHTLAQNDLRTRGSNVGITVADTIDAEHRALMTRLMSLSGYAFDTAYMNSQVRDHQNTLNLFNNEISGGQHQNIRSYAQQYQPHIQMHFTAADSIRRKL